MELRAIEKSWFAVLNESDIVEEVIQMPSSVEGSEFIKIPAEDQSLVGKRYNRVTGEFEVAEYYYAELDSKGIVIEIITSPTLQEKDNWVQIPAPDQSLIGKWYDEENKQFIDPPTHIIAAHSTNEVNYKNEDKWLSDKLDEMDTAIANCSSGATGRDGKSAYEIAVENGYTGTEIQWLESLKGTDGIQGEIGATGSMGPQGPKGEKGDQGTQGPKGDTGEQGVQGPMGPMGTDGSAFCVEQGVNYRKYADGFAVAWGSKSDGVNIPQDGYTIVNLPITFKSIFGFSCPPSLGKANMQGGAVTAALPGLAVISVTGYNTGTDYNRIAIAAAYGSVTGTNWTVWGLWK